MEIPVPGLLVDLESVLRRRGHRIEGRGSIENTLFPQEQFVRVLEAMGQIGYVSYFRPEFISPYYRLFGRFSFRKLARQMIASGGEWLERDTLQQTGGRSLETYLELFRNLQILEERGSKVRLTRLLDNFGASLEHYVSELCVREFRGSSEWGVLLEGLPTAGGDYDVLAWLDPSLVYVECKSSNPNNIGDDQIRHFLQRSAELAPELAVLLIDSDSSIDDFVSERMNPIMRSAIGSTRPNGPLEAHPHYLGIYFGFKRVFVTGPKPSIERQLRRCLQYYYWQVKDESSWSTKGIDFV